MRIAVLALLLTLCACSQPALNANLRLTPSGVRVVPSASARVANVVRVGVSP